MRVALACLILAGCISPAQRIKVDAHLVAACAVAGRAEPVLLPVDEQLAGLAQPVWGPLAVQGADVLGHAACDGIKARYIGLTATAVVR